MTPDTCYLRMMSICLIQAILLTGQPVAGQSNDNSSSPYGSVSGTESDIEYGVMRYSTTTRTDPIATLATDNNSGLKFHAERGYLDALLESLQISPASQLLVFSRTSLNIANITPKTPRVIYFNDTTYVAMVPGSGVLEIASMDPHLGPVFYTLEQKEQSKPRFEQQTDQCLRCHDSYSMTGGGVPRFILGSGYTGANGNLVSHEGWILTDTSTPLESRWGGWYVTGKHGKQVHLGNIAVNDPADLFQMESLRIGNITSLETLLNTDPYLAKTSDIVALMVIEHQVEVQNLITRVNYDIRSALDANPELLAESGQDINKIPDAVARLINDISAPLVGALLMVDEEPLTDTLEGAAAYAEWFTGLGPFDNQGRSLREFDLKTRLFRYPLSYLIYSPAFDNLPDLVKQHIYQRLAMILGNKDKDEFTHLTTADRTAILAILNETKPEFMAASRSP